MAVIKGGFEIVKRAMLKELMKRGDDGIMLTLPKNEIVDLNTRITMDRLIKAGIDPESLTSPDQVLNILDNINNQILKNTKVLSGKEAANFLNKAFPKKGEVVQFPQKRSFAEEIEAMKKSGDIVDEKDMVISDKITNREMFKQANEKFNKTDVIADTIARITSMEPVAALKEANKVIGRKGVYKNLDETQSKKILKDTEDWIFQRDPDDLYDYKKNRPFRNDPDSDPEDMATGGIAKFYTGGMVDVEPNLSDIGHGSDALMARTRLVAPNSQATTSTGLNYLLAEDNDNIRVPFKVGGDAGRRAFLKLLATLTGGAAAFKTGILGLGEGTAKKAVTETVKQSAGSGTPPPYFFRLVEKIKFMGDDTLASQDKARAYKYKDYVMEEDFAGNIEIIKKNMDDMYPEEVYMNYTVDDVALKNKKGYAKAEEYEEFTARPDGDGKMKDIEQGVPDEVIDEAGDTTAMTLKEKADGGRINFRIGGSPRKFLEKVFGKDKFKNMIENDPELEQGMLEVVEMFRNRDKEGLKMYLQKFLPHMDDATIEDFIVGSGDISGIEGQLLRLGSGRDYAGKIEMMKKADNMRKLDSLDVTEEMIRKPNAEGGRIGLFLGGGLTAGKGQLKKILEYMAKGSSHGKTGSEILQMVNPKQFNKMLNDPSIAGKFSAEVPEGVAGLIQNYIKQMKTDRANMVGDIIGTGRKMKKVDDDIVTYKIKIVEDMISKGVDRKMAEEMAETMAQVVSKQAGKKATPKITDEGLLEMENIQKNLITKDRKLQAAGGLTTMLGE